MLRLEIGLTLLLLLVALLRPCLGSDWFEKLERKFRELAARRRVAVFAVGFLALILRAALLPVEPIPEPIVHDEFGYLLAADTYAHGRLTNPPHPMWEHFETFSIIQQPTYQCFAQPAQGLFLAVGEVLFGLSFWGVWLSSAFMCGAITWALQPWVGEGWALLGGAIAILRFGLFSYWADSYWGGAVGALGGALVLGSLPRIRSSQRPRDAVLMAIGLVLLANSRPYEGFVFSLPITVALLFWIFRKRAQFLSISLRRVVLPLAAVMVIAGLGMTYYFWRVTGDPFRMPYQVERETYSVAPYMLWQHLRPVPSYRHLEFARMYAQDDAQHFQLVRTPYGIALFAVLKLARIWAFFLGPALSVPLLMMFLVLPYGFSWKQISTGTRFLMLLLGFFFLGLMGESYFEPHYAAPITCVLLALVLTAMKQLDQWAPRGGRVGVAISRMVVVVCLLSFGVRAVAAARGWELSRSESPAWYQLGPKSFGRAAVVSKLSQLPGRQLVIVHYSPTHNIFDEWVYNAPDIDQSKVVWARDMGAEENAKLTRYFKDRHVWTLEADVKPPHVVERGIDAESGGLGRASK
jgi:hypothetical protein